MNFYMPVHIAMGEDCVAENAQTVASYGKRAFVVTDGVAAMANGSLSDVEKVLTEQDMAYTVYSGISSNPTVDSVREGARAAVSFGADVIIAVGGGSSLDAGKAIALLATQGGRSDAQMLSGDFTHTALPLITIPTTSGTGSEATPFAMLTSKALGRKINLNAPVMYSKLALLDPKYTLTVPKRVRINTAIDAMSHAMESMLTVTTNPLFEAIALEALEKIGPCLKKLAGDSMEAAERAMMMYACALSGMVVGQTRTSALHGMSYPITFRRELPHGRAVGLLLIPYLEFVGGRRSDITDKFMRALGLGGLKELAQIMDELLGEKERFSEEEISEMAAETAAMRNIANSIVRPGEADIAGMFRQIG